MSESSAPPTESRGARDGGGGVPGPAPSPAVAPTGGPGPAVQEPHYHDDAHGFRVWRMTRPVVLAMCAACLGVFWFAGWLLQIPAHAGYEASLLQQPGTGGKVLAVVVAAGLFVACTLLVELVAVRRWVLVGPFAAAVGLAAWSIRGGPSVYVYRRAATEGYGAAVFPMLLLELFLLFAVIAIVWWMLITLVQRAAEEAVEAEQRPAAPKLRGEINRRRERPPLLGKLQGLLTQVAIIGLITLVLTATADKAQVLASVLIASTIGTGLAEHYFKDEKVGPWLWAGPLVVGALGYLLTWLTGDAVAATQTGRVTGTFAPLARPLPLDYASFGTAGALLGYWMAADMPRMVAQGLGVALTGHLYSPAPKTTPEPELPARAPGNGQVG